MTKIPSKFASESIGKPSDGIPSLDAFFDPEYDGSFGTNLVFQMLMRAIADYARISRDISQHDFATAKQWIFGPGDGAIPFYRVCEILQVNEDFVRGLANHARANPDQMIFYMTQP